MQPPKTRDQKLDESNFISSIPAKDLSVWRRKMPVSNINTLVYHIEANTLTPRTLMPQVLNSKSLDISKNMNGYITPAVTPVPQQESVAQFANASQVVSQIAYVLSDISFVYPSFPAKFVGRDMLKFQSDAKLNVAGGVTKVIKMRTNNSAGNIALGAASKRLNASVVLSSAGLDMFLPSLYNLRCKKVPSPVFHVALQSIDSDLKLLNNSADVYKVAMSGSDAIIINSAYSQASHDLSVISHILSILIIDKPVVHFFDAVYEIDSLIETCSTPDLKSLLNEAEEESFRLTVKWSLYQKVEKAFNIASSYLGRLYRPFLYQGPDTAITVIVILGSLSSSTAILQAVTHLGITCKASIGLLRVLVFRPWNSAALFESIPNTVRHIIVIDSIYSNTESCLYRDIKISTYGLPRERHLEIHCASFDPTHHCTADPATFEIFLLNFSANGYRLSSNLIKNDSIQNNHFDNENFICWVLDLESDFTFDTQSQVFGQTSSHHELLKLHSQRIVEHVTDLEPVILTQFRFSSEKIISCNISENINFALLNNISILKTLDVASQLKENSVLVINTGLKIPAIFTDENIPSLVISELVKRKVAIYTIDANQIAKNFTIFYGNAKEYVNHILESVIYHFSFSEQPIKAESLIGLQRKRIIEKSCTYNIACTTLEAIQFGLCHINRIDLPKLSQLKHITLKKIFPHVPSTYKLPNEQETTNITFTAVSMDHILLPLLFWNNFGVSFSNKPPDTYTIKVTANIRLTPKSYDRNVFHLELDTAGTGLKYEIGEALAVHAPNDSKLVESFLRNFKLNGKDIVRIVKPGEEDENGKNVELITLENLLTYSLDIFGKPGKKFYNFLVNKITSDQEKEVIAGLLADSQTFEQFVENEKPTFADLLLRFPSALLSTEDLVSNIPPIKPRLYSISSSQKAHPNSVHLLIVLVEWKKNTGEVRYGHASNHLVNLKAGDRLTVSIKPSVMKLPSNLESPVIMSGLGTGMAPFRAFIQERWYWKQLGKKVGPMILYFGSRYREMEFLYGEELDAYVNEGILTSLRLAFSRDQKEKVYIQHKIEEDCKILHDLIVKNQGSFYLCGPTWPVPDVTSALLKSFGKSMDLKQAVEYIEKLKNEERFVMEVY